MAIAFDKFTDGGTTTGTSLTYSHTCTGSNLILFVGVMIGNTDLLTGITYAGTALTEVPATEQQIGNFQSLWMLVNPASGANNVVVSLSASEAIFAASVSYTGAKQSAQPDASVQNKDGPSATSSTSTVTTTADNCWLVSIGSSSSGVSTIAAGAGATKRGNLGANNQYAMFDSNGPITPAGSASMTVDCSPITTNIGQSMASFAPAVVAGVSLFMLTGVGT